MFKKINKKIALLFSLLILVGCSNKTGSLLDIIDNNRENLNLFITSKSITGMPYKQEFDLLISKDDVYLQDQNNDILANYVIAEYIDANNNEINDMLDSISNLIKEAELVTIEESIIDESKLEYIFENSGKLLYLYSDYKIKIINSNSKTCYIVRPKNNESVIDEVNECIIELINYRKGLLTNY